MALSLGLALHSAQATSVRLAWNPNTESDVTNYRLSYGTSSGTYSQAVDCGLETSRTISGLQAGTTYYFTVQAVNVDGLESPPSSEVAFRIPDGSADRLSLVPRTNWVIQHASSQEAPNYSAAMAIDGSTSTFWHTAFAAAAQPHPHEIRIDLGEVHSLGAFRYLPRQDSMNVGNIGRYEFYVSMDGSNWGTPVASGQLAQTQLEKQVEFSQRSARYVRLVSLAEVNGLPDTNIAEFNVLRVNTSTAPVPENRAPVAVARTVTTNEDTAVSAVLAATDADGDTLTYTVLSQPSKGTLSGAPPNLTYTPNANANGSDSFTYRANDGKANSNSATVSITITPVNDAPVALARNVTTNEDNAASIVLAATDADGDALTFTVLSQPSKGKLSGTPPNLSYTPNANANGSDSFTYRANDGKTNSNTATVSITITPVNDAPVALAQSVTTPDETTVPIMLAATDADGDTLTFTVLSQPSKGTLSGTPPNLSYTPNANATGSDSFTYRANDGKTNSNSATVSIAITPKKPNESQLVDRSGWKLHYVNSEDVLLHAAVLSFDGDPASFWHTQWREAGPPPPHEIQIDLGAVHRISGFRYLPRQDEFDVGNLGQYEFYLSADGSNWGEPLATGEFENTRTEKEVTFPSTRARYIRLRGLTDASGGRHCNIAELNLIGELFVNTPPKAQSLARQTIENQAVVVELLASDGDGDELSFEILRKPANGTLAGKPPKLTYIPAAGFDGADSFTFRASDGTAFSGSAMVNLTVRKNAETPITLPVKPPVIRKPAFKSPVIEIAGIKASRALGRNASIADSASSSTAGPVTYTKVNGPAWLKIAPNGQLSGTPPLLATGINRFTVRASNGPGSSSDAVLQVNVGASGLPLPWKARQLGRTPVPGDASHSAGAYLIRSSGRFTSAADNGNFAWQTLGGNGTIIARVSIPANGDAATRAGVMIRESLAPNARHAFLAVDGSGKLHWLRRTRTGTTTHQSKVATPKKKSASDTWLRLDRKGDVITAYRSANGKTWTKAGSTSLKLGRNIQIGMVLAGGKTDLSSALFRNVRIVKPKTKTAKPASGKPAKK